MALETIVLELPAVGYRCSNRLSQPSLSQSAKVKLCDRLETEFPVEVEFK